MKRYALVVGISQYTSDRLTTLKRARADAQAIHDLIDEHGDFKEIHLLQDEEASYDRLLEKLEYVLLDQGDKSEVLLYFSGHGLTAGSHRLVQQGHLATYDCVVRPNMSQSGQDFWLVDNSISFQVLSELIAESNLAGLAVFLDCCHSERFIEQMLVGKGLRDSLFTRQYFLSMACRGYEYAYENEGEPYSAYTAALLRALRDEAAGKIDLYYG